MSKHLKTMQTTEKRDCNSKILQLLRVPANSSATSFQQAVAENGNLLMFKTDDMKMVAKNVGKSLRTVRWQVARAIQAGEIQQVKHGEYKEL